MPATISLSPRDGRAFIAECLAGINRHRKLFVAVACLVTVLSFAVVGLLPTRYTAAASVVMASGLPDPLQPSPLREELTMRDDEVATQAALMTSRDLAIEIVRQYAVSAAPGVVVTLEGKLCTWAGTAAAHLHYCAQTTAPALEERVVGFLARLHAAPVPRTRMIEMTYTDADPVIAAGALNALVEAYQKQQIAQRAADLARTSNWITERAETLRHNWLQVEASAGAYRSAVGLTSNASRDGVNQPLVSQQVASAASSLSAAQADLSAALGRQEALRAARSVSDKRSMVAMRDEPGLVALATQLSALQTQLDDMRAHFNKGFPGFAQIEPQIASLERQIDQETSRALHAIDVDVQVKRTAAERMQRSLKVLRGEAGDMGAKLVQVGTLDDEARSARVVFETFLARAKQLDDRASLLQSQVQFAAHAVPPGRPSFPDRSRMWLGCMALGLSSAAAAAWLRDYMARGFNNISRIGASLSVPFLCAIPKIRPRHFGDLPHYVQANPFSTASESMRSLLAGLQIGQSSKPALRSVIVASATGQEGKTTTSIWLATIAAQGGNTVLLVDGDHRRGLINRRLRGAKTAGFSDLVFNAAVLDDVLQRDEAGMFDFIGAGAPVSRPFGQAEVRRLRDIVAALEKQYDLVIIDTPPLFAITDALIYAAVTSGTIFICRWGRTSRVAVASCLDRLRAAQVNVLGVALSMVDHNRLARFSDELTPYDLRVMTSYYIN